MSNIIAVVWDFDKTLIGSYMQEPIFNKFGVDGSAFWKEVNSLPEKYKKERVVEIQHASGVVNKLHIYGDVGTIVDEAPIRECKVISYESKSLSLEWFNETPGKIDNYTRISTFLPFIYENTVDKL